MDFVLDMFYKIQAVLTRSAHNKAAVNVRLFTALLFYAFWGKTAPPKAAQALRRRGVEAALTNKMQILLYSEVRHHAEDRKEATGQPRGPAREIFKKGGGGDHEAREQT